MRLQALPRGGGGGALPARHHRRLRLRRRAADARRAPRLPHRGGSDQLGRPAGVQGRRAARGAAHGLRGAGGAASSRRAPDRRSGRMIARRTQEIEPFLAVEVFQRAQALERQGIDVIHLEFGEPDFDTPAVVREAAERALKDGRTRYAHSLGLLPLREAIAEHYHARYGVTVSPEQILVTAGTSPAMLLLFSTLLDPGDEVLLTDPRYAVYPNLIRYPGGECVHTPTWEVDGFQCRPAEFAA